LAFYKAVLIASQDESMLRIEDLSVSYGSVKALEGVGLEVSQRGLLHGVIGPNGAGKSTLMDAITGRCKPTRGRVFLNDSDITARPIEWRRRMGMSRSFQRTSIFPGITVGQQLEMVALHLGETDLNSIVDTLELNAMYDLMADSIAYGDQRRVDIALALVGQPSLMLLDEPAAGLSTAETIKLFEHLLAVVRQRNVTALVVEHDVEAVFKFCDAITALDLGKLLTTGTPAEVRRHPDVISAYLGSSA
jgi:branched-chain amino acid transport system ATP-binding protein